MQNHMLNMSLNLHDMPNMHIFPYAAICTPHFKFADVMLLVVASVILGIRPETPCNVSGQDSRLSQRCRPGALRLTPMLVMVVLACQ
jgi:hypothetical protein